MKTDITMKTSLEDLLLSGARIEFPNGYWFRRHTVGPDAMKRFNDHMASVGPATQSFLRSNFVSPENERLIECGIGDKRCEFFWQFDTEGLQAAIFELGFREKKWPT